MTKYINNNFENLLKDKIKNEYQNFDIKTKYDFNHYKIKLDEIMKKSINMIKTQFNKYINLDELTDLEEYFIKLNQNNIDDILIQLYKKNTLQEGGSESRETHRDRDMRLILTEQQQVPIRNNYNYITDIISILFLIFGFFMLYIAYHTLSKLPDSIEQMGMTGLNLLVRRIQDEIVNTNILTLKGFIEVICGFRLGGNITLQTFVGNIQQIVLNYFTELGSNTLEDVTQQLSQQCGVGISHDSMFGTIFNTMTTIVSPSIKTNCITQGIILNSNMLMNQYGMILNKLTTEINGIGSLINYGVYTIMTSSCHLIYRIRNRRMNRIDMNRQLRLEGGYKKSKKNRKYNKRYNRQTNKICNTKVINKFNN